MGSGNPIVGFGFYFLGIAMMAITDAIAKSLGADYPVGQLVFIRCAFGLVLVIPFALKKGIAGFATHRLGAQILRGLCMMSTITLIFLSVRFIPLAEVAVLLATEPLFVVALAVPLLGERVSASSILAVIGGFVGALFIIGADRLAIGVESLLPLGAAISAALVMIITRDLTTTENSFATVWYGYLVVTLFSGLTLPFAWVNPSAGDVWILALLGVLGSAAAYFFMEGCRYAPINRLTPLEYTRIAWGTLFGYVIWHEVPEIWIWFGAALIVGSGLYTMLSEKAEREFAA